MHSLISAYLLSSYCSGGLRATTTSVSNTLIDHYTCEDARGKEHHEIERQGDAVQACREPMVADTDIHQKGKPNQSILNSNEDMELFVPGRPYPLCVCLLHAPAAR